MNPGTLETWAHGYERQVAGRPTVKQGPVITSVEHAPGQRSIPFVGLVEATVVQAFRRSQLPMQRIRKALEVLGAAGELDHALASRALYIDGANVLYDYANSADDMQLRLLTVVISGQVVFHDLIDEHLKRITFDHDLWATELVVPVTEPGAQSRSVGSRWRPDLFERWRAVVGGPLALARGRICRVDRGRLRGSARRYQRGDRCPLAAPDRGLKLRRSSSSTEGSVETSSRQPCEMPGSSPSQ